MSKENSRELIHINKTNKEKSVSSQPNEKPQRIQMPEQTGERANIKKRTKAKKMQFKNEADKDGMLKNGYYEPKISIFRKSKFDFSLFTIILVLLCFGVIMMFSASYAVARKETGDSFYYFRLQLIYAVVGLGIMIFVSYLDYHILLRRKIVVMAVAVGIALLIAVKLFGTVHGGAKRWLAIGPIEFQPSEVVKFVVIMLFAFFAQNRYDKNNSFKEGFLPYFLSLAVFCGMIFIQPHLSGTIIVFAIGVIMMFVGGVNYKFMLVLVGAIVFAIAVGIPILNALGYDYFESRFLSFYNPEADIQGDTFQTYQSLVTIGSGGFFGLGLGNSRQKYSYLPESQNDFVFSIICEELGFVGAMLVILLFMLFVFRGFYVSAKAKDRFGMMLGVGITAQIGLQALMNIAVVSNSMPNTGISLPFFSYGGTALLMQMAEMGVLLSVSREAAIE